MTCEVIRRHPEQTLALVFVDGSLRPLASSQEQGEQFIAPFRNTASYSQGVEAFLTSLYAPSTPVTVREEIRTKMLQTPAHVVIRVLEIGLLPQADPQTWLSDTIGVPVLGVYTKMPYVPLDNEQFLRGLAPDTTYLSWDEVGHYLMLEKPQEFNAVLLAFLEEKGLLHE